MDRLVERIELEPALGVRNGLHVLAASHKLLHQALQRRGELTLERPLLGDLPVVEVGAVTEREPLEEAAGEEGNRLAQHVARRTICRELAKALDVQLKAAPSSQGDAVAGRLDPLLADRLAQRRQRAPERAARVLGIMTRPQQLAERLARPRALHKREMRKQRHGLARVERDRRSVSCDTRRPDQHDLQRHQRHDNGRRDDLVTASGRCGSMLACIQIPSRRSVMSQVTQPTLTTRSQLRAHWIVALSALLALLAAAAVMLVLVIDNGTSTTTSGVAKPQAAVRSDGGPSESAVAAAVGSQPSAGPDESTIAASIGGPRIAPSIGGPRMLPAGPDESTTAASIGR